MDEPKAKENKPETQRRFSQEQYDMLIDCSKRGPEGIAQWNKSREQNPNCPILLEGACFKDAYLEGANLMGAKFCPETERGHTMKHFVKVYSGRIANLRGTNLRKARLKNAVLNGACLKGTDMSESSLQRADLMFADLEDAMFLKSDLRSCVLEGANIKGADISRCDLRNANFRTVIVDGATTIWKPKISKCKGPWRPEQMQSTRKARIGEREYTDFQGVGLEKTRIDPRTKQLLEYNIRRKNWEQWYLYKDWDGDCEHKRFNLLQWLMFFIRFFWQMSDYGRSTGKIIGWFFGLALLFAAIYANCAYWSGPGIVSNLAVEPHIPLWHYFLLLLLRPVYFSVVTMTTLGFGDMHANATSIWGHVLLTFEVILGYVLLGALVTRFAVLFTAGGPAGRFANEQEEKDKT